MAYETGVPNSGTDLLDKLRLFVLANGWAVNRWSETSVSGSWELCIQKSSQFLNFKSVNNGQVQYVNNDRINTSASTNFYSAILMSPSDGYDGGSAWDEQPGAVQRQAGSSGGLALRIMVPFVRTDGPFQAYHFFLDGDDVNCVVEMLTGEFLHFGFGVLQTYATPNGNNGRYVYGTTCHAVYNSATHSRAWLNTSVNNGSYCAEMVPFRASQYAADNSSTSNHMVSASAVRFEDGANVSWAMSGRATHPYLLSEVAHGGVTMDEIICFYNPSPLNGAGVLTPNIISILAGGFTKPLGLMRSVRYTTTDFFTPGQEISYGNDTWKIFPWYSRNGFSLNAGIAYKKVT